MAMVRARRRVYLSTAQGDAWTRVVAHLSDAPPTRSSSATYTIKPRRSPIAEQIRATLVNGDPSSTGWLTGLWGDDKGDGPERDPDWGYVKPESFEPEASATPAAPIEKYGTLELPGDGATLRFQVRDLSAPDANRSYEVMGPAAGALRALIPAGTTGSALATVILTGVYSAAGTVEALSFRVPEDTVLTKEETGRPEDEAVPQWVADAARDAVENRGASWEMPSYADAWVIPDGCPVPKATQPGAMSSSGTLNPQLFDETECVALMLILTAQQRGTTVEQEYARLLEQVGGEHPISGELARYADELAAAAGVAPAGASSSTAGVGLLAAAAALFFVMR